MWRTWLAALSILVWVTPAQSAVPFVPDELLVGVRAGFSEASAEALYAQHGSRRLQTLPQIHVHRIRVPAASAVAVAQALSRHPAVRFVSRNFQYPPTFIPNDPAYPSEWHLPKIAAPQAWDITVGVPQVIVAILDSGVLPTHPDLAAKLVVGTNTYDNNTDTHDVFGHGTKVAGAAAAIGNNGIGVAGVAMANDIMPIRVTDTQGYAYSSTLANGLTWAVDHGAKVMNMSFGSIAGDAVITSAAQYVLSHGGLVVGAAGNCGCLDTTANNASIISVSSTGSTDAISSFSSYGPYVDVAAPGEQIYTTSADGQYAIVSGTSFSSPITAGVLGLMMSINPSLSPADYEQILKQTAVDLGAPGWDQYYGFGRVNANAAVALAQSFLPTPDTTPPQVSITSPTSGMVVSGSVTVNVSATDNVAVVRVDLYVDGTFLAADSSGLYTFLWDSYSVPNGSHTLLAQALDAAGNVGFSSPVSVTVNNVADTTPPTVTIGTLSRKGLNVKVPVSATDNVGVMRIELYLDGALIGSSTASAQTFTVNTKKLSAGTHTLVAKAYDAAGNVGTSAPTTFTK